MPMTFKDEYLERQADMLGFRKKSEGETIADYRAALADHVQPIDAVEAQEIRSGLQWDKWGDSDVGEVASRSPETLSTNPLIIARVFGKKHADS